MPLSRTDLRTGAVARLVAAATTAATRVTSARIEDVQEGETLPILVVHTPRGREEPWSTSGRYRRIEDLVVEGHVAIAPGEEPADPDAELARRLEQLEQQVKVALLGDRAWLSQFERTGTIAIEHFRTDEAGRRRGSFQITIPVQWSELYRVTPVSPELDVARLDVQVIERPGGVPVGPVDAQADVTLP